MREHFEHLGRFGHEAEWLDRDAVQREVASPTYHAGVWRRDLFDRGPGARGLGTSRRSAASRGAHLRGHPGRWIRGRPGPGIEARTGRGVSEPTRPCSPRTRFAVPSGACGGRRSPCGTTRSCRSRCRRRSSRRSAGSAAREWATAETSSTTTGSASTIGSSGAATTGSIPSAAVSGRRTSSGARASSASPGASSRPSRSSRACASRIPGEGRSRPPPASAWTCRHGTRAARVLGDGLHGSRRGGQPLRRARRPRSSRSTRCSASRAAFRAQAPLPLAARAVALARRRAHAARTREGGSKRGTARTLAAIAGWPGPGIRFLRAGWRREPRTRRTDQVRSEARVVVIGGGVAGCSLLYHLTKLGWTDVVLVEADELTSGSTWHAAGLCTQFIGSYNLMGLLKYSLDLYQSLEAETGQAVDFHECGSIRLATDQDRLDEFHHRRGIAQSRGRAVRDPLPRACPGAPPARGSLRRPRCGLPAHRRLRRSHRADPRAREGRAEPRSRDLPAHGVTAIEREGRAGGSRPRRERSARTSSSMRRVSGRDRSAVWSASSFRSFRSNTTT